MRLNELGERRLVTRIRRAFARPRADVLVGIGDDAALVKAPGSLLLSTDVLVEDQDFRRALHPPRLLGRKALNVNLSDIAAMGGRPLHALVGLAMPGDLEESWLRSFMAGLRGAARASGAALVGGDLSRADKIFISVTVTGEARHPVTRSGARPGDRIYVSGTLGDAAMGLRLLEGRASRGRAGGAAALLKAFLDPAPRLILGARLARRKLASAMIDVSDGLSVDLAHICEESGVGAEVDLDRVPLSPALKRLSPDPLAAALDGGEDFELLFTVRPANAAAVRRLAGKHGLTEIGRVTSGRELIGIGPGGKRRPLRARGFDHFKRRKTAGA
ncbi:MAG: thiamine-phosphate kinase [Candidatus Aminicenantes bacterium]|nr:thiamine-phosphate kinase [Candidatus Aminicenantes bacterium]